MTPRVVRWGAIVLGSIYLAWGGAAVYAGRAYARGYAAARAGDYASALARLDHAAWGGDAAEARWLVGEVQLGRWDEGPPERGPTTLHRAVAAYLDALLRSPASGYPLTGLAQAFFRAELEARKGRPVDLDAFAREPWSTVGRDGRTAIGLLHLAIRREPNTCAAHDALVTDLVRLGLVDEARAAARAAALAAPALQYHPGLDPATLPKTVLEAFADGSREALAAAPLAPLERKLFYLGLLEERLGRGEQAAADLERAYTTPAPPLHRAEIAYHLGGIRATEGRIQDAERLWSEAASFAPFRVAVALARARLRESTGRTEDAIRDLAAARAAEPRRLDLILWEARLQGKVGRFDQAVSLLRWGVGIHPDRREPRRALVEALRRAGRSAEARAALREFERRLGEGDDTRALEAALADSP